MPPTICLKTCIENTHVFQQADQNMFDCSLLVCQKLPNLSFQNNSWYIWDYWNRILNWQEYTSAKTPTSIFKAPDMSSLHYSVKCFDTFLQHMRNVSNIHAQLCIYIYIYIHMNDPTRVHNMCISWYSPDSQTFYRSGTARNKTWLMHVNKTNLCNLIPCKASNRNEEKV